MHTRTQHRKSALVLILALLSLLLAAPVCAEEHLPDLRQSVAIVEPTFSPEQLSSFEKYALYVSRASLRAESRYLTALQHGISGSGVVVRVSLPSGGDTSFLVTNRHVVSCADSVQLTFKVGSKKKVYRHCRVLAVSPLADLALVELPNNAECVALQLDTAGVFDGQDIQTAGYPGLGGNPSWQLTKGSISNSDLRNTYLLGKNVPVYQHTAPIDAGSSGGPLLLVKEHSYCVAGINTWKASYRDGVGLAIPSAQVRRFLIDFLQSKTPSTSDASLSEDWNQLLRDDYVAAAEQLSVDCVCRFSAEEWYNMFYCAGESVQKDIREYDGDDPFAAMRQVLAFQLFRYLMAGGEQTRIDTEWTIKRGEVMISDVNLPSLTNKQLRQATKYLKTPLTSHK